MGAALTIAPPSVDETAPNAARIHAAALQCIARFGLTKTTLDDIARESGLSRATLYREHPGGRDTLLQAVLVTEIDRFFAGLAAELDRIDDLEDLVVAGLGASMRFLRDHPALRTIVALEPGVLLPAFAFHRLDAVLARAAAFAEPYLAPHLADPSRARSGAEHLVRIVLSYTMHPSERVDPADGDSVRRLVHDHVLPGLLPAAAHDPDPDPSTPSQPTASQPSQKGQS